MIYDVTAVAVLPDYGQVRMPTTRLGPRRVSPLWFQDRLKVKRVSLASPLEISFIVTALSTAIGVATVAANRVLLVAKTWQDILAAGVDIEQREQALAENRELAPERLRQAQLSNSLREQQLRIVRAEADLTERLRDELLGVAPTQDDEPSLSHGTGGYRFARAMTSLDFADLLDDPMRRLLSYSGGEIDIVSDEGNLSELS